MLTKPVSRSAFVVVKAAVNAAFVTVLLVVGTALTWALTAAMFGTAPGARALVRLRSCGSCSP